MKRRTLMAVVTLLAMVLTGCGGKSDKSVTTKAGEPEYTIKVTHYLGEQHIIGRGLVELKKLIEEKTDGRVEVELHLSGTLGASDEENLNLLMNGSAQIAAVSPYLMTQGAGIGDFNIYELPYIFHSFDEMFAVVDGPLGQEINEKVSESTNAMVMGFYSNGEIAIIDTGKAIHAPEDLHGMNLRTAEAALNIDIIDAMGGSPTPLTYSECYTALQQKTIDGVVVSVPLMYNDKLYEVCDYLTLTRQSFPGYVLLMNKKFYNDLPEDLQQAVSEACTEMVQYARNLGVTETESAAQAMADEGVKVNALTEEELDAFREAVQPVIEKYSSELSEGTYEKLMEELERIRSNE